MNIGILLSNIEKFKVLYLLPLLKVVLLLINNKKVNVKTYSHNND